MATRLLIATGLGAGLLLLGACGWEAGRNTASDDTPVGDRIASVRVTSDSGNVTIRAGERTSVHRTVHYDSDRPGATQHVEGDTLVLDSCPVRRCWIDYEVTVPAGTTVAGGVGSGAVELDGLAAVNLRVESGDVTMRGVAGKVNVDVASGAVHLVDVGDTVVVRTESGDVTIDGARAAVTVQAESGAVRVNGAGGSADVHSESGDVAIRLAGTQNVRVRADSGTVEVAVPHSAYQVSATTDSGDLHTNVADDPAGTHQVDLHTGSGNITLSYS